LKDGSGKDLHWLKIENFAACLGENKWLEQKKKKTLSRPYFMLPKLKRL